MIDVLFEDNHLLVVNKPSGLPTQSSDVHEVSLEILAKSWLKEKYQKPGNVFLGVVHRLDLPVSGIVLFAKTSKALSRLNALIREKQSKKIYTALVEGKTPAEEGTLEHYLKHEEYFASVSNSKDPQAKLARLHYKVVRSYRSFSLLEIVLETGRYHQIRAQFAAVGCPIVGDLKYGSRHKSPNGLIALHHSHLEIVHPVTHVLMHFESKASFIQP